MDENKFIPLHLREDGKSYNTLKLTDDQVIVSLKARIEVLENDNIRVLSELTHCREELNKANDVIKDMEFRRDETHQLSSSINNSIINNSMVNGEPEKKLTPLQEFQERRRRLSARSSNTSSLKTAVERIQKLKELRKSLKQPEKVSLD
jgi:hypothetical protein